jgi:hypothetical protein
VDICSKAYSHSINFCMHLYRSSQSLNKFFCTSVPKPTITLNKFLCTFLSKPTITFNKFLYASVPKPTTTQSFFVYICTKAHNHSQPLFKKEFQKRRRSKITFMSLCKMWISLHWFSGNVEIVDSIFRKISYREF